jgi:integrase
MKRQGLKLFETISEEELKKILEATKKPYHKLAFALGFYQAMRVSEVVKLQPGDIDTQSRLIHIKQSKGAKDRMIPIAPEVMKGLRYLPIKCGIRSLQIKFKQLCKEVLGKDLHFHTLRHSGITHYLTKKKWNSLEAQRFAGHSKIQTTEVYTHIKPEDLVSRMWGET